MESQKRILPDIREINTKPIDGIIAQVDEKNNRLINAIIYGPIDTPYEGGKFKIRVFLQNGYPQKCPQAKFETLIYHPNIDSLGRICHPLLKEDEWIPETTVLSLLTYFQVLLAQPNPHDPLATGHATVFIKNCISAEEKQESTPGFMKPTQHFKKFHLIFYL
jgi:ubiquitin-conjugating enzyme E2 N